MKKYFIFITSIFCLITACRQNKINHSEIPEFDVNQSYDLHEITFQEVGKVSYIPLETHDDALLGFDYRVFHLSENYLVITNRLAGDIMVFSGDGKLLNKFNHKGNGSEEYLMIKNIICDENQKKLYVVEDLQDTRILIYSFGGDFIHSYKMDGQRLSVYGFDENLFLSYDENGMLSDEYSYTPYQFITKNDGHITDTLELFLPVRYYHRKREIVDEKDSEPVYAAFSIAHTNSRYYGDEFVIGDISCDTVFRLNKEKILEPLFIRTPSVHETNPPVVITPFLSTDHYIFFTKLIYDFKLVKDERRVVSSNWFFDRKNNSFHELNLKNEDFPTRSKWNFEETKTFRNTGIVYLNAFHLIEAQEENKLYGDLKELTSKLNEEDNGILMVVKFD